MWCANVFALSEKEHFPKELWDVIDPKGESDNPDARKKTLKINTKSARDKLADFDDADEAENEAENEAVEKKNPDDEFDEDENDDMADDYNAERYFEDGEEDYEDGGGGGDDDGDGY
jgi:DNA-directed RNA polymerase III subunit RPC7